MVLDEEIQEMRSFFFGTRIHLLSAGGLEDRGKRTGKAAVFFAPEQIAAAETFP